MSLANGLAKLFPPPMNCEDLVVLQAWANYEDQLGEWKRYPELEGPIGQR